MQRRARAIGVAFDGHAGACSRDEKTLGLRKGCRVSLRDEELTAAFGMVRARASESSLIQLEISMKNDKKTVQLSLAKNTVKSIRTGVKAGALTPISVSFAKKTQGGLCCE
jgi:hypothetical protein